MVPSSRRGKTSSETQRRKSRAARKGKWPPRGTGTTVLTCPCPTASRVPVAVRESARVTGKAGENGQNSGEGGGRSAWTRPSAPECGDTLKALAGDQRPILGGDRPRRRLRFSLSTGSPAGRAPPHGDGSMYSQGNVRGGKCAAPPLPERCRP